MNTALSPLNELPVEIDKPAKRNEKIRINSYLGVSCVVFLALIVSLTPDSDRWLAVVLSMSTFTFAILAMVNSALGQAADQIDRLQYKLKLNESKFDRLKIKYNDACQMDDLTSCFNKQHFLDQCQRFMSLSDRSGVRFSVIVLEIDQYVEVLSHRGQRGSNELLRIFGNLLHRAVREVDVVARVEDERFALLLSGAVDNDALTVTNRITALAGQIHPIEDRDTYITISVGAVSYHDQEDVTTLVDQANSALNMAIDQGRNRVAVHRTSTIAA